MLGRDNPDAPERAALAAGCALEQGLFWEMHSALFERYRGMDMSQHMQGGPPNWSERELPVEHVHGRRPWRDRRDESDWTWLPTMPASPIKPRRRRCVHDLQDGMQLEISSVQTYIINGVLVKGRKR